jgi:hypothetical protein
MWRWTGARQGALPRTAGAGPSPAGRRTGGLERSVASDRYGIPAGHRLPGDEPVRIAAPDARLQAAIRPEDRTCRLDCGCDSTVTRELLDELGLKGEIARKASHPDPGRQPLGRQAHARADERLRQATLLHRTPAP